MTWRPAWLWQQRVLCARQPLYVTDAGFLPLLWGNPGTGPAKPGVGEMFWSEKLEAAAGRKKSGRNGWQKERAGGI